MSEVEVYETRTLEEELVLSVIKESCYAEGYSPRDVHEFIKRDDTLIKIYKKEPYNHHMKRSEDINEDDSDADITGYFYF